MSASKTTKATATGTKRCAWCPKTFDDYQMLYLHQVKEHQEERAKEEKKLGMGALLNDLLGAYQQP